MKFKNKFLGRGETSGEELTKIHSVSNEGTKFTQKPTDVSKSADEINEKNQESDADFFSAEVSSKFIFCIFYVFFVVKIVFVY